MLDLVSDGIINIGSCHGLPGKGSFINSYPTTLSLSLRLATTYAQKLAHESLIPFLFV